MQECCVNSIWAYLYLNLGKELSFAAGLRACAFFCSVYSLPRLDPELLLSQNLFTSLQLTEIVTCFKFTNPIVVYLI